MRRAPVQQRIVPDVDGALHPPGADEAMGDEIAAMSSQ